MVDAISSKEEHEKITMIENYVWEIAKLVKPNSYINPETVKKAKETLIKILEKE